MLDTNDDERSEGEKPKNRIGFVERYHWKLFRAFPKMVPYPHEKESLEFWREKDPEENTKTEPKENEHINLQCFWGVEFYTPSHVEDLISSFKKLGWEEADDRDLHSSPITFLTRLRSRSYGGGSKNLGTLVNPGESTFFLHEGKNVLLPQNVKRANAYLFHLTSSVACIVVQFEFEDEFKSVYENILRDTYTTNHKPSGRGVSINSPRFQKRDRIVEVRQTIRRDIGKWFSINLPGVFSENDDFKNFPTCELAFLENSEAFPEERDNNNQWLSLLELEYTFETWKSTDWKGLKFVWPLMRDDKAPFHATLNISKDNLAKLDMGSYGEHSDYAYVGRMDREVSEMLSRWSCMALLGMHEENLSKIRDSSRYRSSAKKVSSFLQDVRKLVSESMDIACLSPEFIELSQNDHVMSERTFMLSNPLSKEQRPVSLLSAVGRDISKRAERLLQVDKAVKELIYQQGNLISTQGNIKLQKSMRVLTVVFGLVTIFLSYQSLPDSAKTSVSNSVKGIYQKFLD